MGTLFESLVAGLGGTVLMTSLMGLIHTQGWANADMIRALGSLVTRKREGALGMGLAVHFTSGALLGIPYAAILGAFDTAGPVMTAGLGALLGFVHGLVMSLILLACVTEKHPLPEFQKAGSEVAIAHIVGHIAYGFGTGFLVHLIGVDWGLSV